MIRRNVLPESEYEFAADPLGVDNDSWRAAIRAEREREFERRARMAREAEEVRRAPAALPAVEEASEEEVSPSEEPAGEAGAEEAVPPAEAAVEFTPLAEVSEAAAARPDAEEVLREVRQEAERLRKEAEVLRAEAEAKLREAEAEAGRLKAEAREEIEKLRAEAREAGRREGLEAGLEEGMRKGREQVRAEADERLKRFDGLLAALEAERRRALSELEPLVVDLVGEAFHRVLGEEAAARRDLVVHLAGEALAKARDRAHLKVHLNPEDADAVESERQRLQLQVGSGRLKIVPDARIERGGCLVETEAGSVDGRLSTLTGQLKEALSGGAGI